jgi:RNA polymerase primary sigma factor
MEVPLALGVVVVAHVRSAATPRRDVFVRRERLNVAQELQLLTAAETGDVHACDRLVHTFLPAIGSIARTFPSGLGLDREELIQEGVVGLLFAARRYDAGFNTPFWAYASFWVRKAMQRLVAELTRPVALSDRAARDLGHIHIARREHLRVHGTEPTNAELSLATELTPAHVESLQATERTTRSIEGRAHGSEDSNSTVGDTIIDPLGEKAFEHVLDALELGQVHDGLDEELDGREREVIQSHYGLTGPAQTLDQIGGSLGLTAERARQIEVGALSKLRAALARPDGAVTFATVNQTGEIWPSRPPASPTPKPRHASASDGAFFVPTNLPAIVLR